MSKQHEITKQDDLYFRPDSYYTPFSPTLEVKDSSGKYDTIMQRSSEGRGFGDTSADILQLDIQQNVSHGYNQHRPEVNMIDTSTIDSAANPQLKSAHLVADMVYQQGQLTKLLLEHSLKAGLPKRIIEPYDGDPIRYPTLMAVFEYCIEEKLKSDKDKLYYLEQQTKGEANALVRSCMSAKAGIG